jgi:hypothetical protein
VSLAEVFIARNDKLKHIGHGLILTLLKTTSRCEHDDMRPGQL